MVQAAHTEPIQKMRRAAGVQVAKKLPTPTPDTQTHTQTDRFGRFEKKGTPWHPPEAKTHSARLPVSVRALRFPDRPRLTEL